MELSGFNTFIGGARTELTDIFQPLTTTKTSDTGFKSRNNQNKDLAEMFEPYISDTKADTTNYNVFSTGLDLCETFKPTEFPKKSAQIVSSSTDNLFWMTIYNNWALAVRRTGGGPGASIYYSTNYGINWSAYTNASWTAGISWRGIAAYGTNAIACSTNKVWITSDYGANWTDRTPVNGSNLLYFGVAIYDTKVIVTDVSSNKLYSSPNLGGTWYAQVDPDITFPRNASITKTDDNQFVVVVCCTSNNTGNTASRVVRRIPYDFNSAANGFVILSTLVVFPIIVSLDGSNGISGAYIGGTSSSAGYSRIKYTTDAGATWTDSKNESDNTNISDNIYVCSLSGNIGIAITYTSKYLISIDAGKTWSSYTTASSKTSPSCAIHNNRLIMSENGTGGMFAYYGILDTPFPTVSLSQLTTLVNTQCSAMYKNIVLTGYRNEGLMTRSTDGGKNFYQVTFESNTNFTNASWRYIAIDQTQAVAVSNTSVFTSNDSGATWTERTTTSTTNNTGCAVYNGLMIVADQENSMLYYSTDNGANWLSHAVAFPRGCAITMNGSNYVVAVSSMDSTTGLSPVSFKRCNNFNPTFTNNENVFVDCTFKGTAPLIIALDGQYGACVSYTGSLPAIKYSSDYGQSWLLSDVIPTSVTSVSISGRFAIVTLGGDDFYYVSNDYGQTWTTLSGPQTSNDVASNYLNYFTLFTMSATRSFHYYGQADNLRPVTATVSGFTASFELIASNVNIQNACMYQNFVVALATSGGAMRRSTNYGASFSTVTITGYLAELWKYVAMDQTQAIAVSADNVFTSNDYGSTWTVRSPTSTNFTGCAIYNGLMMVADQANSRLIYSTDNGENWVTQTGISFPRGCAIAMDGSLNYVVLITTMTGTTTLLSNDCFICKNFNPVSTTNSFVGTTYTGAVPFLVALDGKYAVCCSVGGGVTSKIKYSTNFGETWTNISESITTDCYAVSISNGYAMVAPTTSTTYYISNNYGQNWQTRTAPNTVTTAANFSDKGTFFTSTGVRPFAYNGTLI